MNMIILALVLIIIVPACIAAKIQEFKEKRIERQYHRANGQYKRHIKVNEFGETIGYILM